MTDPEPVHRFLMVVEDSATQAAALQHQLEDAGFDIVVARSGEAALERMRVRVPDLLVSDVVMPGMSGFQLCALVKGDPQLAGVPVILLTGLSDPTDILRGLEAGADNYVAKPYDVERLVERIVRLLGTDGAAVAARGTRTFDFRDQSFSIGASRERILGFMLSSFEDVVRANEALRAAEEERAEALERERMARLAAEDANRAKAEFLAAMSHDLRTPLNAIGGYAQLLELGIYGPISDAQLESVSRIRRSQQHLLVLVNDVLNFVRVEAGTLRYDIRDAALSDLLAELEAVVAPQVEAKGLTYRFEPCEPGLLVRADPERVHQLLINLLTNAIKFTDAGGTITLSGVRMADTVRIDVSDTGPGIPPDRLEAIFDPFVQVHAGAAREGIGLGLAISRNLARGMGGDLTVESELGRGSTFHLQLPIGG